jgi:hypothetical protein
MGAAAARGRIYVDLDDVLSRTIEPILELLELRTGRRVALEEVRHFDLGRSFGLSPAELAALMLEVHRPERLEDLLPRPGAARTLAGWIERGYAVAVVTGRPPSSEVSSRRWLLRHEIPHTSLACVDKYGRPDWSGPGTRAPSLDALAPHDFVLAVEDSLEVAARLATQLRLPVALFDHPWNRDTGSVAAEALASIVRCRDWDDVARRFPAP